MAHKITYVSQTHFIFINGIIIKSVAYATAFNPVAKLKGFKIVESSYLTHLEFLSTCHRS
jgi:hypothetical protein